MERLAPQILQHTGIGKIAAAGIFSIKDKKQENQSDGKSKKVIGKALIELHLVKFFCKGKAKRG
jgi:phosphoribosylformimino-5-aminoimidazole carboxamide ribonucleotide (ProFAR) isomerase